MKHPHLTSGGRYPVLRAVAILFMIGGTVASIGYGIRGLVYVWTSWHGEVSDKLVMSLAVLAGIFLAILITVGIAELIKLFIDIEHNTRLMAMRAATAGSTIAPGDGSIGFHEGPGLPLVGERKLIDGDETAEGALLRGH